MPSHLRAFRGSILHCVADPSAQATNAVEFYSDGTLLVENGLVVGLEHTAKLTLPDNAQLQDLSGHIIVPGFVDTHVHFPQVDVIASFGTQLLEWLERYTFPVEMRFDDLDTASETASFFLDELIRNGTTTALVFGTVHRTSVDAFFTEAQKRKLRMICGKVLMDRHAPDALCDTPQRAYDDSKALIEKWHNEQRLGYAITPRFAPTSSDVQLAKAGQLLAEYPGVHMHTHLAENKDECAWVASLFPKQKDYVDVYEQHGLLGKRSVFAHAIHLSESEWQRMGNAEAAVAHCPCSNLFIGSGLFDLTAARAANVKIGLGTDIGGGDSFSMLRSANEAYKIQQLRGVSLKPEEAFYMATLGGAKALDLDQHIGNFQNGKEADFVVLDPKATAIMERRTNAASSWQETLFALLMLGDDRAIHDTYILGESAKQQPGLL